MTFREIYRQQLCLRGVQLKKQIEAEEFADRREPFAAAQMNRECPPEIEPLLRKLFSDMADTVLAPIRERQ